MNEHNGSRFAHITRAHPCFNEKMHDKVGRAHVPVAPKCNIFCNLEIHLQTKKHLNSLKNWQQNSRI